VDTTPQFAPELTTTSDKVNVACPLASRLIVTFWQLNVGAELFTTVTVEVQLLLFPLASVAVKTTLTVPTSEQVKVV